MTTRASVKIAETLNEKGQVLLKKHEGEKLTSWAGMLDTLKEKFRPTTPVTWAIAPSSAQSFNGLAEGNVRVTKMLLCSHLRILNLENYLFQSLLHLQRSFTATHHLLNNRPVYYSESQVITCNDLMFPGFQSEDDQNSLKGIVENTDQAFQYFTNLHNEAIVSGKYLKYGSKVVEKKSDLAIGDFVMITGAGRPKYGLVQSFVSKHRVSVRMLIKRNKEGDGTIGNQVQNLRNLVHLPTPVK